MGWDWRVEKGACVHYGSSNSRPQIEQGLYELLGVAIKDLVIQGQVPELLIEFSNGQRLISAAMCTDMSEWNVRLPGPVWISCDKGVIYSGEGEALGLSPEEEAGFDHAHRTAKRWGTPTSEGAGGAMRQLPCHGAHRWRCGLS